MRTFWIPLIVLPLGCAHQGQSMVETEPAAPPPAVAQAEPSPPPKAPPKQEVASAQPMTCGLARVHFEFDKAELTDANKTELDQMARCLGDNERLQVRIEGNTDERGSQAYNQDLGQRRAQAVLSYLESHGVPRDQLQTVSFGKDRPICLSQTDDCFAQNRRTAIRPLCRM